MTLPAGFTGLMVATPCYGGVVTSAYMRSVLDLALGALRSGLACEIMVSPGDSLVQRARNTLSAVFMGSPHSHLLFIDADVEFQPQDAVRLLLAGKPLICGIYPKKSVKPEFPLNWLPDAREKLNVCPQTGAVEIMEGPTGFMMIRRDVFAAMMEAYPDTRYRAPDCLTEGQRPFSYAFFDCRIEDGRYLSEDFTFCRKWRALGGKVWMLPDMTFRHHGMHGFAGCVGDILEKAEPAEVSCAA